MSDEVETTESDVEPTVKESLTVSIEDTAREMGWKPKAEFTGDESEWKGAGAFVKDAELFKALKQQSSEINDLKAALSDVKGFLSKSEQAGYQRAIVELQQQRKDAISTYDLEKLEQADNAYLELQKKLASTPTVPGKTQAEIDFESRNQDWYNDLSVENSNLKNEAAAISSAIAHAQPLLTPEQHIRLLEDKMRALYPEKLKNRRRDEPSPVDAGKKTSSSKTEIDTTSLSPEMLASIRRQVRVGVFKTEADCIKAMKKAGVI